MKPAHVLILSAVITVLLSAPTTRARHMQSPAEQHGGLPLPIINPLRPLSGSGGYPIDGLSCESWQFAVETNNLRDWATVPGKCEGYVGNYMLGGRYRSDSAIVVAEAIAYLEGLQLTGNGSDVWIFDVDETTLSNLPYYTQHGFGAEELDWTVFQDWELEGAAPALPETLKLYNRVLSLGVKPVIITGRHADEGNMTKLNLENVGYRSIELILKPPTLTISGPFKVAERAKLVAEGYRIVGNIGDQWSDLLGAPEGDRTFKLPNPMYYVG